MLTATATEFSDRVQRIEISATLAVSNEAARLRAAGVDLVDFGAGEPHFNTPQHIKDAAIAAIQSNFTKYTAVAGIPELRQAIVNRHQSDFGSSYGSDEVGVATGGKQALFNAIQVLVDHGDEVILPVPYWTSFKDIVEYSGGKCVWVKTEESKGFQLIPGMIERALTPRTRVIILNSPNNPSGAVVRPEDLTAIALLAHERGIYVVSDECYVYLNYTGKDFSLGSVTEAKEHLVIIGSLSKTYAMTGWRLGFSLAPRSVAVAMQKLQGQSTSSTSAPVQKAGVAALTGPQDCVQEMKKSYIALRDQTVEGLLAIPGVRCSRPEGAFYAYPNVSAFLGRKGIGSVADLATRLLHEGGVATVPGTGFGTSEHLRLSYAVSARELDRGLKKMHSFFAGL